jgi:homoserine O-acetyltransferase/O-succinyltransferase
MIRLPSTAGPLCAAVLIALSPSVFGQELKFASFGDLRLENGSTLRDCRLAYRTYGALNGARSNAILFPTWFTGTSAQLADHIGPGKLADTNHFFVIAVDALGDGVSTSPSNSTAQPRMNFPQISIGDMVRAEYLLASGTLGLRHLYAVMGISMGGMQTFEWAVDYPDFLDKAVPIVGSPQLTSYDLLLWTAEKNAIESDSEWKHGDYQRQPPLKAVADIHNLALTTPQYRAAETQPAGFSQYLAGIEANAPDRFDANNWLRQLEAMMTHDVARHDGGSLAEAARRVKAGFLAVVAAQDHMVNPGPARRFAEALSAPVIELTGPCGHLAPNCENARMVSAVASFLNSVTDPR